MTRYSDVSRAIGVTSSSVTADLLVRTDHHQPHHHQVPPLALRPGELGKPDRAPGAALVGELDRAADQLLAAERPLHGTARLVPAPSGVRGNQELQRGQRFGGERRTGPGRGDDTRHEERDERTEHGSTPFSDGRARRSTAHAALK
jgi:hypothetical protein